ncbi:MAG TPA: hypothetical protein VMX55_10510 [candidate division Zixibacteria bacterium]|nr:hypothetical protein [candidate division Zixibacteria bacterium]
MKRNIKNILFFGLILTLLAVTLVANNYNSSSPVRPMRKIRIFVTRIDCQNLPPGATYTLTLYPEYLRLFEYYGDELTQDSNYEDWSGGNFEYPVEIASGSHTYYDNLYCDWSLCMDFNQEVIENSGEVYLQYKLKENKLFGETQYITKYYDSYSYDTQYITNLYFGMGTIKVYITFQLLS